MQKEKYPQKIRIAIIALVLILTLYYFLSDKPFGISRQKEITAEQIENLQKIIPEEMYQFLFSNDSLKICLNKMADYNYRLKDSIVYDSVISGNKTEYTFIWNRNERNWRMGSRYYFRKDTSKLYSVAAYEDYYSNNDSWHITSCDSFFRNEAGEFIMQKSLNGYFEKYDYSEVDNILTTIYTSSHHGNTKTVEITDKITGKIIKKQKFSRSKKSNEWDLTMEKNYKYNDNIDHIKTFYNNEENELTYSTYYVSNQINDSLLVKLKYSIDTLGIKSMSDSSVNIKRKDNTELTKHYMFSDEQKLVREEIDSNYYDTDSNHYYYSRFVNYIPRHGHISFHKYDNSNRTIYRRWRSWNNDSTKLNNSEEFGYFTPNKNITVKFKIKQTKDGEKRINDNIDIEFTPDKFNSYKINLYWSEENECYKPMGITLLKHNLDGDIIEQIDIR